MEFSLSDSFYYQLFIVNLSLVIVFAIVYYFNESIFKRFKSRSIVFSSISSRERRFLKKHFRFYRKLSPQLKRVFEEKLEYFYHAKVYECHDGQLPHKNFKLLISAYAAQLSMGMKNFHFPGMKKIIVYPDRFLSQKQGKKVKWEMNEQGVLSISWKDFYYELRNENIIAPIGLKIMAYAIKLESNNHLKEEIYKLKTELLFKFSATKELRQNEVMYVDTYSKNKDNFFMFCLLNYFANPHDLKNSYPAIFKKMELILYKEIA